MTAVLRMRLLIIFVLVGVAAIIWLLPVTEVKSSNFLTVQFLDVGQGDAILITTPDNKEMLIDGGRDASVLRALSKERSLFDKHIDVVVATHPDLDHIGGLIDVLERYDVGSILLTENEQDTPASMSFSEAVASENATRTFADANQRFLLGEKTIITILSPYGDEKNWESNTASIIMKVEFGETSFMLTGDSPASIENSLVEKYGTFLDSDVLKLGHHGSKTSTSDLFLDTVTPAYAVVSAGIDNQYGHPHQEVMQRVFVRNIESSHTGTDGTVTFVSDGVKVWRE